MRQFRPSNNWLKTCAKSWLLAFVSRITCTSMRAPRLVGAFIEPIPIAPVPVIGCEGLPMRPKPPPPRPLPPLLEPDRDPCPSAPPEKPLGGPDMDPCPVAAPGWPPLEPNGVDFGAP